MGTGGRATRKGIMRGRVRLDLKVGNRKGEKEGSRTRASERKAGRLEGGQRERKGWLPGGSRKWENKAQQHICLKTPLSTHYYFVY